MSLGDHAYTVLKDCRKKRRVLIQFIILLLVLLGIFYAFFFLKSYTPMLRMRKVPLSIRDSLPFPMAALTGRGEPRTLLGNLF